MLKFHMSEANRIVTFQLYDRRNRPDFFCRFCGETFYMPLKLLQHIYKCPYSPYYYYN